MNYRIALYFFALTCLLSSTIKGQRKSSDNLPLDSLRLQFEQAKNDEDRYRSLWDLTFRYVVVNADSGVFYGKKYLSLAENNNDQLEIANANQRLGVAYWFSGDVPKAFDLLNKALDTYIELNDKKNIAKCYINLGNLNYVKKNYNKSLQLSLKALDIQEKIVPTDTMVLASLRINLAASFQKTGKYGLCHEQLDKVLVLIGDTSDRLKVKVLVNKYQISKLEENYEEALDYMNKALLIAKSSVDRLVESDIHIDMGNLYLQLEQYEAAMTNFEKAYQIIENSGHQRSKMAVSQQIGWVYFMRNDFRTAKKFFLEANRVAEEYDMLDGKRSTYESLAQVDSALGNFYKAYEFKSLAYAIRDSIFNIDKARELEELTANFELDKKNEEISLLTAEKNIKSLEAKQQRNLKIGLLIGTILLAISLGMLYNRFLLKKKAVEIIEEQKKAITLKNTENELLIKETHHRVKNNLQIISSLLNTKTVEGNKRVNEVLLDSQNKIKTMALIHQNLYNSDNFVKVHTSNYFKDLIEHVKNSNNEPHNKTVTFNMDIDDSEIKMDLAVPLGLILNELITNSYKYAFNVNQKENLITIKFKKTSKMNSYNLEIYDNGNGLPKNFDIDKLSSFGLQMVKGLVRQLNGEIQFRNGSGAGFNIYVEDTAAA